MHDIKLANILSQALLHFVMVLAEWFTDNKVPGPPMRAKQIHVSAISEHTYGNSPTVSSSSF